MAETQDARPVRIAAIRRFFYRRVIPVAVVALAVAGDVEQFPPWPALQGWARTQMAVLAMVTLAVFQDVRHWGQPVWKASAWALAGLFSGGFLWLSYWFLWRVDYKDVDRWFGGESQEHLHEWSGGDLGAVLLLGGMAAALAGFVFLRLRLG